MLKKLAMFAAAALTFNSVALAMPATYENVYAATTPYVEYLDRGISAVKTGTGMLVSWRFLGSDTDATVFKLYRDNTLIYTSNAGDATCYLDASGSSSSSYKVETVLNGNTVSTSTCSMISGNTYFDVPLDNPNTSLYTPNDCSVGDVDGDGEYELFVKWDPNNSQDNSKSGVTDKVYIDCYKLNGTKLWRIDLGINIRAGAHYTQFLVADFDLDGCAEMTCKTADGTIDGVGNVIGDSSADYRNSSGYILSGPEYYTLFDGATGAALDTVNYNPQRGTVSSWGDNYGNRVDRFLGAVAYLDGVQPYAVTVRGYYTRLTACAYKVENDKLVQYWYFDTGNSSSANGYGDGNHNCMPADVDSDGKQEILFGALCLDDNGTVLWNTNKGHGDAMHLSDFLPDNNGLELWVCHEVSPYGATLIDCDNGSTIFHYDASGDTGRCAAANVWSGNAGGEFWFNSNVYNGSGGSLSMNCPAVNFFSYWDGDLEREILDGYTDSPATITDINASGKKSTLLTTTGYYTCNTTKGTPCLSADLFGDWREELVVRAADGKSVRIYATDYDTDYRVTTLMHDVQYRTQVAGQNIAYNQPPHTSFYLGSDKSVPSSPSVIITPQGGKVGAVIDTTHKYMIKNSNSGLYLEVEGSVAANGTNVAQGNTGANGWTMEDAGDGYYRIYSEVGDGKTYLLDLDYGKVDNGTNIGIWGDTASDAQLFKFVDNGDGTYTITTKATEDASCLGVVAGSTDVGANVVQWACDGSANQSWILEIKVDAINGKYFTNLVVKDTDTYQYWSIDDSLSVGDLIYGDRTFTYTAVYDELVGAELLVSACDAKYCSTDLATFTAGADIVVYIAIDVRTAVPSWLSDWTATGQTCTTSNDVTFDLYSKEFAQGASVTLGTNGQSASCINYTAMAVEQSGAAEITGIWGDANGDGKSNAMDATLVARYAVGTGTLTDTALYLCDVNADGKVNAMDATFIARKAVGLIASFPVES